MRPCKWPNYQCKGMTFAIKRDARSSSGTKAVLWLNIASGRERFCYVVKNGAKDKTGLAFNFCPWCGAKINHDWCHTDQQKKRARKAGGAS